jgi:hypothetical protein
MKRLMRVTALLQPALASFMVSARRLHCRYGELGSCDGVLEPLRRSSPWAGSTTSRRCSV